MTKQCCWIRFESESEYLEHIEERHAACGCGYVPGVPSARTEAELAISAQIPRAAIMKEIASSSLWDRHAGVGRAAFRPAKQRLAARK